MKVACWVDPLAVSRAVQWGVRMAALRADQSAACLADPWVASRAAYWADSKVDSKASSTA